MAVKNEMVQILDFILNRATEHDLQAIHMALERRKSSQGNSEPRTVQDLDFKQMARSAMENLSGKYGADQGEIHEMTRRLVQGMIKEKMPGISNRELEALLQQWVPDARTASRASHRGREDQLPEDMAFSMIEQFVKYSLNILPEQEKRELVASAENWYEKYWEIFSLETKNSIKDLLDRKMELHEFWARTKNRLRSRGR